MSQYTGKIMWRSPNNQATIIARRINGSACYPGMVVTSNGETEPDVYLPDGNDDETLGIVLDRADLAIDSAFTDNDWVSVLTVRSGGGAWGFVDDNEGAIERFTALYNTGADDDGLLEVMAVTAAPTTYDDATIQGIIDYLESAEHRYVGRAATEQADQGSDDVPIKVLMV
jgi:hypothetical protein